MQRPLNPRTCKICCTNACHTDAAIRLQLCERCRAMIRLSSHTHACAPMRSYLYNIIIRRITWLPKACRNAAVRQQVAEAVIKAICGVTASETTPDKVVVRARRRQNTPSTRLNATTRRLRREHGRLPAAEGLLPEPGAPGPPRRVERDRHWIRGPHEGAPEVN